MSLLGRLDLCISFVLRCKRLMGAQHQALHWQQEAATEQVLQRVSPAVLTSLSGAVLSLLTIFLCYGRMMSRWLILL